MEDSTQNFPLQALAEKLPRSCMLAQNVPIYISQKNHAVSVISAVIVNKQAVNKMVAHSNRPLYLRNISKK